MPAINPAADQMAIIVLLAGMLVAFSLERVRLEVVAVGGLALGYLLGLVPVEALFSGYANPAVVTVVEVLIIARVLGNARVLDPLAQFIQRFARTDAMVIATLSIAAAAISVFMNNIGALALVLPILFHLSAARGIAQRKMLLPVSYATLLGGTCSVIGTPANLIVNAAHREATGEALGFFSFAYVGLPITVVGLIVIVFWVPRLFSDDAHAGESGAGDRQMLTELRLSDTSGWAGLRLVEFETQTGVRIHAVMRAGRHVFARRGDILLAPGDLLVVNGTCRTIAEAIAAGDLSHDEGAANAGAPLLEAVVMPESTLVGSSIHTLDVFHSRGVGIVGIGTRSPRIEGRLADQRIAIGDILYLTGEQDDVAAALRETESLQLFRPTGDWRPAPSFTSLAVFAAGVLLTAFAVVPPEVGFGLVLVALLFLGKVNLRTALADLNWPIVVMLASLIPLAAAVETTGAAASIARWIVAFAPSETPELAVGLVLFLSFVLTPFINNASAAIVLVPVASEMARQFGCPLEALLFAIAVGVSIDFITPVGHHNNTVAMGIGGYRFRDFPRAGWPVSCATLLIAFLAIVIVWA